jgi:uncharacterized Ntn-hydrolase superfamily protein
MTYSIVAWQPETGELGVGVQSRAFGVGPSVPWAEPGVGAVATQAVTERSYGPLGLRLLRSGKTPEQALAGLLASDPGSDVRQVAIVGGDGSVATHTGAECIPDAGHLAGEGFSAQANMCRGPVWEAMAESFSSAGGSLAQRLLSALEAGDAAGGDFRGRQSAALLVRPAEGQPWDRVSELRVEDHADPLGELRRLLTMEEAYRRINRAERGRAAIAEQASLPELDVETARFLDAANEGDNAAARALLAPLIASEPRWEQVVRWLARRGSIPDAEVLLGEE